MGKLSSARPKRPTSPVRTVSSTTPDTYNHEAMPGYRRDAESELFLLAVTNMVGEDTFYEKADDRDARFRDLIRTVAAGNPEWLQAFIPWLRDVANMRSASVVAACEYVRAGAPFGRRVVDGACQRADEPAEVIGYWLAHYGRPIPKPVKRGVADAAARLYSERSFLKNDSQRNPIRMADVVELSRPAPRTADQALLFKYMLDDRHHPEGLEVPSHLAILTDDRVLLRVPEGQRRELLRREGPVLLEAAGWTWERLAGWLPGGMDAEAWEAVIPQMGVMALLRNLRNFDAAKISRQAQLKVRETITDPDAVKRSRIFPFRVWAAYREAPSDNWSQVLGETIDLAAGNVPALDGSLVLIDTSSSMGAPVSGKSKMARVEVAALMAMITAHRARSVDVVIFGDDSAPVRITAGWSILKGVQGVVSRVGEVGHGTMGFTAVRKHFDPARHKRVVLFTDDQMQDQNGASLLAHVPLIYTFNLAGYRASALPSGADGRYSLGGFNDASFALIEALERRRNGSWPWEA